MHLTRFHKIEQNTCRLFLQILFFALFLVPAIQVKAHKAILFAWLEGNIVHTESKLSGGKTVKNGKIIVYDMKGKKLLTGKTNLHGEFSFKLPQQTALRIELKASMGHGAEWLIPAEETKPQNTSKPVKSSDLYQQGESQSIKSTELEVLVEKIIDRKLQPIQRKLAESQQNKISLIDILGGLGYIIGLVGLAAYFQNRTKEN